MSIDVNLDKKLKRSFSLVQKDIIKLNDNIKQLLKANKEAKKQIGVLFNNLEKYVSQLENYAFKDDVNKVISQIETEFKKFKRQS